MERTTGKKRDSVSGATIETKSDTNHEFKTGVKNKNIPSVRSTANAETAVTTS